MNNLIQSFGVFSFGSPIVQVYQQCTTRNKEHGLFLETPTEKFNKNFMTSQAVNVFIHCFLQQSLYLMYGFNTLRSLVQLFTQHDICFALSATILTYKKQ